MEDEKKQNVDTQTTTDNAQKEQKTENTIVEKHAQINPKDFDFVHKEAPEVAENADVVELQPRKFMGEYDKHVASKPFEIVDSNKSVQDNFEEAIQKEEKSLVNEQAAEISKNVTVDDEKSAVLIPENNVKEDKTVAVPVVMVPEMKSKNSESNSSEDKKVVTKIADNVENNSQVSQQKEEKTVDDSAAQSENSTLSLRN